MQQPPLASAFTVNRTRDPVAPPEDNRTGLRKVLSKISLRSNKSRSRLSEVSHTDTTPLPQAKDSPRPPDSGPDSSRLLSRGSAADLHQRSTNQYARSTASTTRQTQASGRKEWFDTIDVRGDDEHKDAPLSNTGDDMYIGTPAEETTFPSTRTVVMVSEPTRPMQDQQRSGTSVLPDNQSSVLYEQTMFSFNNSDSDSDEDPRPPPPSRKTHNRYRSRGGSGATHSTHRMPKTHRHKRNTSSRSQATIRTASNNTSVDEAEQSFGTYGVTSLAPLEDVLTESLPSLVGSGSSRPVSWMSSHPGSPLPPLRPGDLKLLAQFEHNVAFDQPKTPPLTMKELRRSGSSIVSDLKQGSSGNRIIAAISPEEAILLAKIRRNRHDQMIPPSPTLSEAPSKASETVGRHTSTAELQPASFGRHNAQPQASTNAKKPRPQSILPPDSIAMQRQSVLPPAAASSKRQSMIPTTQFMSKRLSTLPQAQYTSKRLSMLPTAQSNSKRQSIVPTSQSSTPKRPMSVRLSSDYLRGRMKTSVLSSEAPSPPSPPDTPAFTDFPSPPVPGEVDHGGFSRSRTPHSARSVSRVDENREPAVPSPPASAFRGRAPERSQPGDEGEVSASHDDVMSAWKALGG